MYLGGDKFKWLYYCWAGTKAYIHYLAFQNQGWSLLAQWIHHKDTIGIPFIWVIKFV